MTTNPREPEVLATIETHAVAAQPVEVIRHPDGTIGTRALPAYWCDDNPFSAPGGELWNADDSEWGTLGDVPGWAGLDDLDPKQADRVAAEVATGDFPDLPTPRPAPSGTVARYRESVAQAERLADLDSNDDEIAALWDAVEQATGIVDRLERLWRYITIDPNTGQPRRPGDGPSSADTCEVLYETLAAVGLEVS